MPNILILTAAYGEGHNAAARGLQTALAAHPEVHSEVWDPFQESYGKFYEKSRQNYLDMITHRPGLWAWTYRILDRTPIVFFVERFLFGLRKVLARGFSEKKPAAVVSVYPLYPYLTERLYRGKGGRPFRFYTVVTDSITINSVWHRCTSDLFFVPNEATAEAMRAAGVPSAKLRVLGFPVPPIFAEKPFPRPAPFVEGTPARVLYMINTGPEIALELVERLLKVEGVELTITVGRNEKLMTDVQDVVRRSGKKAEVLGWITNMPELVMQHHLLIGKAGGAATQEAIAARTPMIVTKVVPGQEEGNAQLLVEQGCGAIRETPAGIADQVRKLFANDAAEWSRWHAKISEISRPDAALRIAEAILGELGEKRG